MKRSVFLTAEWRNLAMLNYEIEPKVLAPFVPAGLELDDFGGRFYVSIVGFLFADTRVFGIPIPFHRTFEEVNLRFYVRRPVAGGMRRGVVFIKEIVPRVAIATVARRVYGEPYVAMHMRHRFEVAAHRGLEIEYAWKPSSRWQHLRMAVADESHPLIRGSFEEFITEHYWGYTKHRDGTVSEYQVEHPPWKVRDSLTAELFCSVPELYGSAFAEILCQTPPSAFLAEGSAVQVYQGSRLG